MDNKIMATIVAGLGFVYGAWGGLQAHMQLLLALMAIDILSGLWLAGHPNLVSKKGKTGHIESGVCWRGLVKKGMALAIIGIGYLLDNAMGLDVIGDGCILAFVVHELISVTENAALMGLPIPKVVKKMIGVLGESERGKDGKDG